MDPVPRARLCQLDPPCHSPDVVGAIWSWSPRRARSSSRAGHVDAGRRQHVAPSRCASLARALKRPAGPHSASPALARFISSLRYFQRMMSGRAIDWKGVASMASAMACPRSSTPDGKAAQVEHAR